MCGPGPSRGGRGRELVTPRSRDIWAVPAVAQKYEVAYTIMRRFKKQNSKNFSPNGPHENVVPGPRGGFRCVCCGMATTVLDRCPWGAM